MDRTLLETVHLLGFDIQLALIALLCALEGLLRLVESLRHSRIMDALERGRFHVRRIDRPA